MKGGRSGGCSFGAEAEADFGGDDDGFGFWAGVVAVDAFEVEAGGFAAQLHTMLIDGGESGGDELAEGFVGESEYTELMGNFDSQFCGGVYYAEGLVVGDGEDGVGAVGQL